LDSKTVVPGAELYSDKGLWNFSGPNAEALSKADVWSLGMTIENLETGKNPSGKADSISEGLRPIVASMLCINYKDRKSAAELLEELK
jgi:serine/threonine protein kinase